MPLVYCAPRAAKKASKLMPDVVVENAVAAAILRGDLSAGSRAGYVFLDDTGVVARIERHPGRLRERPKAWLIVDLQRHSEEHRSEKSRGAGTGEPALRHHHEEAGRNGS